MSHHSRRGLGLVAGAGLFMLGAQHPAVAQTPAAGDSPVADGGLETVFVTARKRTETAISVPVSVNTLSAEDIERRHVDSLQDVTTLDPSLTANVIGTAAGGQIFLRGVGTSVVSNASFDQSVVLDLDGVPISRGNLLRVGFYDLDQISILKGPQALFFGKNSPAGVISIRTRDPTDHLDISSKLSYEPESKEKAVEAAIGGPIVGGLRGRLFARWAERDGEKDNLAYLAAPAANAIFPGAVTIPSSDRAFGGEEKFVRGTLLLDVNDRFTLRAKGSYYDRLDSHVTQVKETFDCPRGLAQNVPAATQLLGAGNPQIAALANALSVDDCKLNGTVFRGAINPNHFQGRGEPNNDSDGFTASKISEVSLDANFELNDVTSLKLVSGYIRILESLTASFTYGIPSVPLLDFFLDFDYSQFSQEARVQTDSGSPVNFMVGAFVSTGRYTAFNQTFGLYTNRPTFRVPNTLVSGFGQVIWDIIPQLELAGGARYTRETKDLTVFVNNVIQPTANPNVAFSDVSPEATLTWRPSENLTIYGAFKEGFKAGGYSQGLSGGPGAPLPTNPLQNYLYQPEGAQGEEIGLKAILFDQTLSVNSTAYKYRYSNLQVSAQDTTTGVPVTRVTNAASADQKGIDLTLNYAPRAIRGLNLYAAANFNPTSYGEYIAPCWPGQSIVEGCTLRPDSQGRFTSQDVSGDQLINAPEWVGAFSGSYMLNVGASGMAMEFGVGTSFKSSFNPAPDFAEGGVQRKYWLYDAQLRLFNEEKGWDVALIGRNLGNVYRAIEATNVPLTGLTALTGTALGGVAARPDLAGNTNGGRAIYLQLTLRPSQWIH